ncbi:serine/threonine-protein kinase [Streptomyces gilvosporeus]|uniref:non-specific serine/threonine protein kinase n=1 Tax=Streptomyces gilvosporeus TaxID=553510 RepID=A0A1V0TRW1_9ACTN|nr:serine/threonine-protein kinase [Streptomyces gilvosporeus]ARF55704.1 serine/threonine protein kinase [Streptomyces gilvosporeus]
MSDLGRLVAGRYRLVERVGRGGMGTVWRAEDEVLGRHVAVKKLHVPPHLQDDEIRKLYERTRREARSAARITHPNVIVVHDVVDDEGLPCIVMEYIPSVTLSDVLKRQGALPVGEVARIGRIMAAALRAAHAAGVLHRDVKPANVLLGNDGRIVLTDFGIAVESGTPSLTRTGELLGSIQYLAPERLRTGIAEPGPACDLWSLGATLYQAVEGRHPFQRDTPIETAYAIAAETYEPPRNAGDLAPVIDGLLVKEPARRMAADEAERLLDAATGAGAVTGTCAEAGTAPVERPTGPERVATPATAPTATPVAATAAPARGGGRRGSRTALWCASAAVVAAVTGGVLLWPEDGAASTTPQASPSGPVTHSPDPNPSPPPPLPAGYHLQKAGQGFSVPVPDGWRRKNVPGGEIAYLDPTGRVGLRVDVVEFAGSDPLQHWHDTEEAQTRRDNPGYERVRMGPTTFRGRPAGYWEFTFNGQLREYRAVEIAFSGTDGTQYVVYLSAPNAQWTTYRPVFDTAVKGIRLRG